MLNWIWLGFFLSAFAAALWQWLGLGDAEVFSRLVSALFEMARLSVEIVLVLVGTYTCADCCKTSEPNPDLRATCVRLEQAICPKTNG